MDEIQLVNAIVSIAGSITTSGALMFMIWYLMRDVEKERARFDAFLGFFSKELEKRLEDDREALARVNKSG